MSKKSKPVTAADFRRSYRRITAGGTWKPDAVLYYTFHEIRNDDTVKCKFMGDVSDDRFFYYIPLSEFDPKDFK